MNNTSQPLDFTVTLAKEAGDILLKYFGTKLTKNIKTGPTDYATEADLASEKYILAALQKNFPNDAIVTEESGAHGNSGGEYTWIVDPLDGTHHFTEGNEDFGVMICRAKGELIELAVVYNPKTNILATGTKGGGAFLNGQLVHLTEKANLTNQPLSVERDSQAQLAAAGIVGITNLGASANTLVTLAGERRGFVSSNGFHWDFAPPALLLAEAGWHVTDFSGKPYIWDGKIIYRQPGVIAAPAELHAKLLRLLSPLPV